MKKQTLANDPFVKTMLVELTRTLLASIVERDWETYERLCDPSLSAFEPEARGHLVEGLPFHKYYFDLTPPAKPVQTTLCSPHVRMLGDAAAVVSYIRLTQSLSDDGTPITLRNEETRVWQRDEEGNWKHVHFHRSANA